MKINRLFSIAAAALMMVACSSEDTALKNTPAAGPQMQFTATIAAPNSGATTRTEYTEVTTGEAAGTISVAWKENDEIALIHNGVKDVATVKTVNDDGSATITGFITKAENGDGVEVCYPAALWDWDDNTKGAIRNATFVGNITKQDGTLKYIQDNLDVRMAKGELKVDGDKATLNADVKLKSQIAIWKLNLQDNATPTPAALKASQVTVKVDATTPVTIAGTTTLGTATSTVYLAMDAITNENLTIEATVGEATYSCTNEGVTLGAGKYYQSTVKMEKKAANAYLKWDDGQKELVATPIPATATKVQSADPGSLGVPWQAGTYVVEGEVTITGGIVLQGNVDLIIKDGAKLTAKKIFGGYKKLNIYGQANQTGELVVNGSDDDAITNITILEVHSAKVKATASSSGSNNCGGFFNISTFNVYGGMVDAQNTGSNSYGICLKGGGSMKIYGGEVKAKGKGNTTSSCGILCNVSNNNPTVTVYGGKLWSGSDNQKAFSSVNLQKGAGFSGKIYTSSNGSSWDVYNEAATPDSKYVRVGY